MHALVTAGCSDGFGALVGVLGALHLDLDDLLAEEALQRQHQQDHAQAGQHGGAHQAACRRQDGAGLQRRGPEVVEFLRAVGPGSGQAGSSWPTIDHGVGQGKGGRGRHHTTLSQGKQPRATISP